MAQKYYQNPRNKFEGVVEDAAADSDAAMA
jgi:G:T/U-mismatch repair DNA glycosylase